MAGEENGGEFESRMDGIFIKVIDVVEDGHVFFCRLPNGGSSRFSFPQPVDLNRGDVIFVNEDQQWFPAPNTAWPDDSSVGVVRKILYDRNKIVVETSGGGMRILSGPQAIEVEPGNTIQYTEIDGVVDVVSKTPIRYRETGVDEDLAAYIVKPGEPPLTFDALGGYDEVKARAKELIETQLGRAGELKAIGAKPVKGVLFTGAPGTGKTHLARIIADVSGAVFYQVSGPSIVSKWVGDSEETLRRLFEDAAKRECAIIFFDEIDSIAARRSSDSNGESKRVVAQLLTLLDGFKPDSNVIVIAATNRVEDIDEALLRPGRFDWEIAFDLPTERDRLEILKMKAGELQVGDELPIDDLARATDGWSGAMLTAIWTEAALLAAGDQRSKIADEDLAIAFERVRSRPMHARTDGTNGS
ncbi:ATP-binding protein [Jonesia denitrificans]|uniref:Microtubule-severing ATPase n=1 Tax=Jonesia denitrificans (strain ATCC 14870 / DSM 20603 / BCRC 15368 / CIP 55.134 / JCM 11481 / NBRC 15587 / NCTC 10816 / Prevot 55134) TaxID=471856 RepID=C7R200_JONDD|nr:ATP-binding protein [Jonesia denitrificans]ACV09888.1 Microtubule-severing ATPase [Jonesia denitrificans DSM 20603]ASE08922.1 26S protease regulatory subunit [Jonesia denitrificans]QXB43469.1 AAA family ATPase [Jonesia denitrificans]SQH22589.1 ATP-dependent zinc metalloprotease FtsH 2 [Jonesia denitrificans]